MDIAPNSGQSNRYSRCRFLPKNKIFDIVPVVNYLLLALCFFVAVGCHPAASVRPTNPISAQPPAPQVTPQAPTEPLSEIPAEVSMSFANQLFRIAANHVDFFQTWTEAVLANPSACEAVRAAMQSPDRWNLSEQALLSEMERQACPVYQAMQAQEKRPTRGKKKRPYDTDDIPTASPGMLKWLSSCQVTRGELGHRAAEQLKAWVTMEPNKTKLLALLRLPVPCLGSRGIYPVEFDTIVLPRLHDRLAALSAPKTPKRPPSPRIRRSR